ncbi:MAG: pentapeptide repeat-containing protein [Chloroflexota bacterium]
MIETILEFLKVFWVMSIAGQIFTILGVFLAALATWSQVWAAVYPIWKERKEKRLLDREFGQTSFFRDMDNLSTRYYVRPNCSSVDPTYADYDEEDLDTTFPLEGKTFEAIDRFLSRKSGFNHMIILGGSGMGKTSLLLNYYLYNQRRGANQRRRIALVPLGVEGIEANIKAVENKNNTVLFLDAFDENTKARDDHKSRLLEIMELCNDFSHVIITCRTQFFTADEEIPVSTGIIRVGPRSGGQERDYKFQRLYLVPLTDAQVRQYLRKRYPLWQWRTQHKAWQLVRKVPQLSARPMLLAFIPDLLADDNISVNYTFELYEALIEAWLQRESWWVDPELLRKFSERLAVDLYLNLQKRGSERIPYQGLTQLAKIWDIPLQDWQITGRSLLNRDAEGNYKFAHRSIMEYLFLYADTSDLDMHWPDFVLNNQMKTFIQEMIDAKSIDLLNTLPKANFENNRFYKANFKGAILYQANFKDSYLEKANLEHANLNGANLEKAYSERANLRGANLEEANLKGASLRGANLEEANLRGANLEEANLEGASLRGANLEEANLEGASLRGANLEGTNLDRVQYDTFTKWPNEFDSWNSGTIHYGFQKDINGNITQIARDPKNVRNQKNHAVLRQVVYKFWVDGVLRNSLFNEVRIRLNLAIQPDAVDNRPWDLVLQQLDRPDYEIDERKQLIGIYDDIGKLMLILGAPGSGKTTSLLMLAESLLTRASADPTYPTPVVFNLSSWQSGQSLADWLIEELNQRYQMPKKVSQEWIENDELLLLLDGLDEVDEARRNECVTTINEFHHNHMVGMVVCSRIAEYESLTGKLQLQGAVIIRPLTQNQIDQYIADLGPYEQTIAQVLKNDNDLRSLAQTPLMLSVITLALQGDSNQGDNASRRPTQRLLDRYIQRMFQHRGLQHKYTPYNTLHWLQWLASKMTERSQTIFLIERLQPNWLGSSALVNVYRLSVGLSVGLIFGLGVGPSIGLIFGSSAGLSIGLIFGLLVGLISGVSEKIDAREELNFSIENGLIGGLSGGLIGGTIGVVKGGLIGGVSGGLIIGPIFGLIFGLNDLKSWQEIKTSWRQGLGGGLIVGLSGGLIIGLVFGMSGGLSFGLLVGLLVGLLGESRTAEAKMKTQPNQGIWKLLRYGLIFGLTFGMLIGISGGLIFGLIFGLFFGLLGGLIFGLIFGVIGEGDPILMAPLKHLILRILLYYQKFVPWNYAHFLDYAAERLFLHKVGGGYVFVHRMILEHIAALTEEDIERIASIE